MSALKYKIKAIISELDPTAGRQVKKAIQAETGLSDKRLNFIMNAREIDRCILPFEQGLAIARVLKKEPHEILTTNNKNGK